MLPKSGKATMFLDKPAIVLHINDSEFRGGGKEPNHRKIQIHNCAKILTCLFSISEVLKEGHVISIFWNTTRWLTGHCHNSKVYGQNMLMVRVCYGFSFIFYQVKDAKKKLFNTNIPRNTKKWHYYKSLLLINSRSLHIDKKNKFNFFSDIVKVVKMPSLHTYIGKKGWVSVKKPGWHVNCGK